MINDTKKTEGANSDALTAITMALIVICGFAFRTMYKGLRQNSLRSGVGVILWPMYVVSITTLVYGPGWDVPTLLYHLRYFIPLGIPAWIFLHLNLPLQFILFVLFPVSGWLFAHGLWAMIKVRKFQNALDHLGLKTPTGLQPRVIDVVNTAEGQKKVLVKSIGIDIAEVKNRKAALESALNLYVQDVRFSPKSRQVIELQVSKRELPVRIPFDDVLSMLTEPFSFLIGEGVHGFIHGSLLKVYHILVAGATGGGKSFFVKQLLVGLLTSSKRIHLYLIDLKMGLEVQVFEPLENVAIARNGVDAIQFLEAVVREMERRFEFLRVKGHTEIDCERDHLDRVVVLVDEASELFALVRSSKSTNTVAQTARDLTDRIAKLGRAAGIHLILATQKVVKETIDTRVQTNMNARMVFRVETSASSVTVLGSKLAFELPDVQGRGIWSVGGRLQVVQTPMLANDLVALKVSELMQKFNGNESPLFQKLLVETDREPTKKDGTSPEADPKPNFQGTKGLM